MFKNQPKRGGGLMKQWGTWFLCV